MAPEYGREERLVLDEACGQVQSKEIYGFDPEYKKKKGGEGGEKKRPRPEGPQPNGLDDLGLLAEDDTKPKSNVTRIVSSARLAGVGPQAVQGMHMHVFMLCVCVSV